MSDETVDLVEETNDSEGECWIYYSRESETEDEMGVNNFNNESNEHDIIYIDSAEMVSNHDNEPTFNYNDNENNYNNGNANDLPITNESNEIEKFNGTEELDNIDDLSKHSLILRETIDENGQLVKGCFCQQCNLSFNNIEDFLAYHSGADDVVNENEQSQPKASTGNKLWDLVENLEEIEEGHNESTIMEMKPNINNIDADEERYFCCHCQQVFKDLNTAENHQCSNDLENTENAEELPLLENTDNNVYRCHLCDKDYSSLRSFSNHQRWHKKSIEQLGYTKTLHKVEAVCEICNTVFDSEKNLKLHMKMHKKHAVKTIQDALPVGAQNEYNELSQFFCEICNKSFDQKLLMIHKNMHQNVEEYVCGKCNKQFENLPSYEIHLQMHIDNMNNVQKDGPSTSSQTAGIATTNNSKRKHACQYCGKEFQRPYEKVKHERIHTGEKPYECEVCGKTFRVSYSLTLHLRTHTDIRPYVCATCNKRFKQQSVYVHHMKTHVNERSYKCDICGKSFRTSVQLSGHKNIHSKPYNCTECNRPFASLYAVKIHMKTHNKSHKSNKNLKNRCSICGASYARLFALRFHIKEQHGIDVDPTQLLEAANTNAAELHKDLDVETTILMNAAHEASNQQMHFMNADNEEDGEHEIERDNEEDDEVLRNQAGHPIPNSGYIDETEAATQTILNADDINVDNFHTEEIITDWLSK